MKFEFDLTQFTELFELKRTILEPVWVFERIKIFETHKSMYSVGLFEKEQVIDPKAEKLLEKSIQE